jgi:MarR family transcriptional regulator, 2-MHQ and catechol-resistance regulon repressor
MAERPATRGSERQANPSETCLSCDSGVRITLVGLLFEITSSLQRALLPSIEHDLGQSGLAFQVLVRIARSPGERLRMSDLASQTGLTPGGLTRTIDRLVSAGLVTRTACAGDRRVVYAELTASGHDQCAELLARHEQDIASILDGVFDERDGALLIAMLQRLRDRVHPGATKISDEAAAH